MSGKSDRSTLMRDFFHIYSSNKSYPIVENPEGLNRSTFRSMITTLHARERERERITEENISFFENALDTTVNRCFFDVSEKIFEIKTIKDNEYFYFCKNLQRFRKISTELTQAERISYTEHVNALDDADLAFAVLLRDRIKIPDDFVKQITLSKTCYVTDKRSLIIIPKEKEKPCWNLIFNYNFTVLITLYESQEIRELFSRFSKNQRDFQLIPPIRISKRNVPREWLTEAASGSAVVWDASGSAAVRDASGSAVVWDASGSAAVRDASGSAAVRDASGSAAVRDASDLTKKTCPKCGEQFDKAGQLSKHKRDMHSKYFSVNEMYKQKYLKYKSKYLQIKVILMNNDLT